MRFSIGTRRVKAIAASINMGIVTAKPHLRQLQAAKHYDCLLPGECCCYTSDDMIVVVMVTEGAQVLYTEIFIL